MEIQIEIQTKLSVSEVDEDEEGNSDEDLRRTTSLTDRYCHDFKNVMVQYRQHVSSSNIDF